ncbi:hypothetical protein KKE26_08415 [bacterium]|nr:hypothetical protein [bacterium]
MKQSLTRKINLTRSRLFLWLDSQESARYYSGVKIATKSKILLRRKIVTMRKIPLGRKTVLRS